MEVLNALINEAGHRGQLQPLPGTAIKFRTSIYADDLVVFLAPRPLDFSCVRQILSLFAGASSLATNVDKCSITPIRWSDTEIADVLQESFHPNAAGHKEFGECLAEFLTTDDRAAACLPGRDGDLHAATSPD